MTNVRASVSVRGKGPYTTSIFLDGVAKPLQKIGGQWFAGSQPLAPELSLLVEETLKIHQQINVKEIAGAIEEGQ